MTLIDGTEKTAGVHDGTARKIEDRIADWIGSGYTPMAQFFAARNGIIFLDGAQGRHCPDTDNTPLTAGSIFPVSSITKTFTGVLVMMLAEEGVIAPTDFVYRHIPEFNGKGKERVTIAHLLTHTSGIDDEKLWRLSDEERAAAPVPSGRDPEKVLYLYAMCRRENKFPPGTVMSYSGAGVDLVGEIIERVTGAALDVLFTERIFKPLGMTNTYLKVPVEIFPRVVDYPAGAYFGSSKRGLNRYSASGGAYSTARDLCIFAQMLLNRGEYNGTRLLSRLSVEAMTRNQIQGISAIHDGVRFREAGWGFSLMLSLDKYDETGTLRSPETYGHSGAGCSMFIADPVNNVVTALMYCTMKKENDDFFERRFDRFFNMVLSGVI